MGGKELVWVGGGDQASPPISPTLTRPPIQARKFPWEGGCRGRWVGGWSSGNGGSPGRPDASKHQWMGPGRHQQVRHSTSSQLSSRRSCAAPRYLCGTAHSGEGERWQQFPSQGLVGWVQFGHGHCGSYITWSVLLCLLVAAPGFATWAQLTCQWH